MNNFLYHQRRKLCSYSMEIPLRVAAWYLRRQEAKAPPEDQQKAIVDNPTSPEDFRPLTNECFQNPYGLYKMLRED